MQWQIIVDKVNGCISRRGLVTGGAPVCPHERMCCMKLVDFFCLLRNNAICEKRP